MQGQSRKNFRLRGRGCGTGSGASGPRCPIRTAGARPAGGGVAAARSPAPGRPPPGASRHGCGPSTTFGRHPPTMASRVKIKPQVDGLRFSRNTGYGRGAGAKRSRWAASVAAASRAAGRGRPEVSRHPFNDRFPANCTARWLVTPFPSSFAP